MNQLVRLHSNLYKDRGYPVGLPESAHLLAGAGQLRSV